MGMDRNSTEHPNARSKSSRLQFRQWIIFSVYHKRSLFYKTSLFFWPYQKKLQINFSEKYKVIWTKWWLNTKPLSHNVIYPVYSLWLQLLTNGLIYRNRPVFLLAKNYGFHLSATFPNLLVPLLLFKSLSPVRFFGIFNLSTLISEVPTQFLFLPVLTFICMVKKDGPTPPKMVTPLWPIPLCIMTPLLCIIIIHVIHWLQL